ncbi:MAG TPA: 5-formyltetrahydrofolate cyclo-ligase [Steroidobacteraceae bacterium]|nr:5-formyltetrahydrofolate cyclo-ligase [Steroidobacteraceae bacterium]
MPPLPYTSARETRRALRARRRGLAPEQRLAAERSIRRALDGLRIWRRGHRIAVFLGMPDEVDLRPCFAAAWRRGVRLYVPRILDLRRAEMTFVPLDRNARLARNRYGIDEPVVAIARRVAALNLDTVLVPLVGFDANGHRLGMGAGFYDRALRRRLDRANAFRRPLLVGVAYAAQQVDRIPRESWDVPLDLVVTERGVLDLRALST